jgi:signal transduction histidine kinase
MGRRPESPLRDYARPVERITPRPPLLARIPLGAWPGLTWCAALLFAVALWLLEHRGGPPNAPFLRGPWAGMALAFALAAQIVLARRWPLPVLGLILAESLAAAELTRWTWVLLLPVTDVLLLYLAADVPSHPARRSHSRRTTALAAVAVLAVQIGGWRITDGGWQDGVVDVVVPIASAAVVAWTLGNSIRQRREYVGRLRKQAAAQAVQAERLRIARELHDMVAHSIGVIAIQAGAAKRVIETQPTGARKALDTIELTSRETLKGLRWMLGTLHQPGPDPGAGLADGDRLADVDRLVEGTTGAGLRLEVRWQGTRRALSPEIDRSAFRIIQESLTNVVRHANARHCRVNVDYRADELAIEIVDDGCGAAPDAATRATGYGIAGMRDRVDLLDGEFSAGPHRGGGFRVSARLPG